MKNKDWHKMELRRQTILIGIIGMTLWAFFIVFFLHLFIISDSFFDGFLCMGAVIMSGLIFFPF